MGQIHPYASFKLLRLLRPRLAKLAIGKKQQRTKNSVKSSVDHGTDCLSCTTLFKRGENKNNVNKESICSF